MFRRRAQRLALVALGALLLVAGGSRLADALGGSERGGHVPVRAVSDDVLFDETFRVRAGGALAVDLGSEDVVVRTVRGDRARVRVEGRGRDAADEFRRRRFTARATDGGLDVRTDPPRRPWSMGRRSARFTVTIEVPRRFDVAVDLGSGDVRVASLRGDLVLDTGSGDVQVDDVDGRRLVFDTGSGDVRAGALKGRVEVDTGSGDVRIDRVEGSLAVDTGSGDVAVGLVDGEVEADTGSGDVEVAVARSRDVEVETGSGDATVRVPRRSGWDVDLDGGSVEIDRALGFRGRAERRQARGRIGGGGAQLEIDTGSGRIRVLSR